MPVDILIAKSDKNPQRFGPHIALARRLAVTTFWKDLRLIFLWHEVNCSFATPLNGNLVVYRMHKSQYFASFVPARASSNQQIWRPTTT